MEILKKIAELNESISKIDKLADELTALCKVQKFDINKKDIKLSTYKKEIELNIEKIDQILENYNANS
jgi:hypothetical protein